MSTSMFMTFSDIAGSSKNVRFPGSMELLSAQWATTGKGIQIVLASAIDFPPLFQASASGTSLSSAQLCIVSDDDSTMTVYVLSNLLVTSCQNSRSPSASLSYDTQAVARQPLMSSGDPTVGDPDPN